MIAIVICAVVATAAVALTGPAMLSQGRQLRDLDRRCRHLQERLRRMMQRAHDRPFTAVNGL